MIIKGPISLKWGDNVIEDVEEITLEHEIDSEDFQTVQGRTIEIDGAYKVTVSLTLLSTDIASLSALLPQHFVANGGTLSTGETVNNAQGAIDIKPGVCTTSTVYNDLDIIPCGNPAQVTRIVNCRTKVEGIEIDNKIQKVMVMFVGEGQQDVATVQMFKQGTIAVVS